MTTSAFNNKSSDGGYATGEGEKIPKPEKECDTPEPKGRHTRPRGYDLKTNNLAGPTR